MSVPSLLTKSNYSFLSSALTIQEIVDYAVSKDHKYVVISDFENAHAWASFYREANRKSLIPVFGLQLNYKNSSVLFLAKNKEGYKELLRIVNSKNPKDLKPGNLILIHLDGQDHFEKWGEDKYIANSDEENGVYIRENKFLKADDFEFFCVLRAIANNTVISKELSLNSQFVNDYLDFPLDKSFLESKQVKNIYKILESCSKYEIDSERDTLNFFDNPEEIIRGILEESFEKLEVENKTKYRDRLESELKVIIDKGFCEYFLIVHDAVKWSKNNGVYVGPGRGSVCGSLIAYLLDITEIDPIKYELYFERFLNATRSTIPDIDVDLANNKRDLLFEYLKNKYGEDHVALIATYQTFKIKNSIREIAKVYEVSDIEIDQCINSLNSVEYGNNLNLDEIFKLPNPIRTLLINYPIIREHLKKIRDYPKNLSVHAAGVIISSKPLINFVPLINSFSLKSTQWDADELKKLGLIKFDFLALQYLTGLSNMESKINVDWKTVDLNDPKVYETIISGRNAFIFQFENPKIRSLIQNYRPTCLLDLALISSIYRPGASDQIPALLAKKSTEEKKGYHEGLVAIDEKADIFSKMLKDTYGFLIYQEQLMKLVSTVTYCSFGEADTFRRELLEKEEEVKKWFFKKAERNFEKEEIDVMWESISKFAKYGFNKSHAVAYAMISYRLMWIKTYYPEVFYAELMSLTMSKECLFELEERNFSIALPSYGKSLYDEFRFIDCVCYFPLNKIVGLSSDFQEQFGKIEFNKLNALEAIQEFIKVGVSLENLKLLIRAGYFNILFANSESEYYWEKNLQEIYDHTIYIKNEKPLFDLNLIPVSPDKEVIEKYKEYKNILLGINFYKNRIPSKIFEKYSNLKRLNTLIRQKSGSFFEKYIGFVVSVKERRTFKDIPFVWLKLADGFYTSPDIAFFGDEKLRNALKEAAVENKPAIVDVERSEDFFKALKIRVIK
ncbi:DNA polymerase III subunit alpha [Candidatus Mycoplasma haematohominis]|uniref:DNA polymerase III subunit alpha n=1 Tax=Candidatus Mycoplasma haematohominis TaxID=1494318 RepID=A0A478FQB6_9MOLU|nr:DNA polymerase III subunit alpha [Candidatus Mycoplasma haemohominis]